MAAKYNPAEIEAKWQQQWEADGIYHADIDPTRPKHYALTMLPYPSGDLHIGHWYAMTPSDARARYQRMRGHNVLFPMGFDAFGLPAENAAIKRNIHPKQWTYANIENMRRQLRSMGTMFDWRREAISADPQYYRWTQWFFLQFFKHGLAYRKLAAVDWCPKDNTTLAREQVVGEERVCERCGTPVIKKNLEQWFFRITNYADELLQFAGMDWPQPIETRQTNWIGRSEGANVVFKTESGDEFTIFTTRPDTLWGATFMVLAPEHPLVARITTPEQQAEVAAYIAAATRQTDVERESTEKEKTGVFTGGYAINPVSGERVPVWIADYVLMTYGTGAIMAVPAHDARDFAFARKYGLEVRPVVQPAGAAVDGASLTAAITAPGAMLNSGPLSGTPAERAIAETIAYLEKLKVGEAAVTYRLRDWLISRQRYWGAPIPIVYCQDCGAQPVPEAQLPVELPEDIEWTPTGESPLKLHPTWKHTTCPHCGGPAERDTDTMDTFMCSSWYFLRYLSPAYAEGPFDPKEYAYWMPVDTYTGGSEHAVMHLLYVRFFHKALRDIGIGQGDEPMLQLRNQGQILSSDHQRMSKSRGNVVDPDQQVALYGADTVRAYLMFGYRWSEGGPWSDENIQGVVRWMHKVWSLFTDTPPLPGKPAAAAAKTLRRKVHQTIQKVSRDLESFEFNTIISAYMELANSMAELRGEVEGSPEWDEAKDVYLRLMAPVTPHIAEELWAQSGKPYSVHMQPWPQADEAAAREDEITLVVQVNGKLKDRITLPAGLSDEEAKVQALASEAVIKALEGKTPRQVIVVKGKLVNIVI
ncbi:MAG: leucine--tRNA ligase [Anaerolineales bacterium]|nr:leucine--tRNA ligase [Anaerolineales bacterium]